PMTCVKNKKQISLLGACGKTRSRSRALHFRNHKRSFGHSCKGKTLYHESESSSGRPGHSPYTCKRSPYCHINSCNFVFSLLNNKIILLCSGSQVLHNSC